MKIIPLLIISLFLISCSKEEWRCVADSNLDAMYSMSSSGEMGSADKGCTCDEIRAFEYKTFREVDEEALKK